MRALEEDTARWTDATHFEVIERRKTDSKLVKVIIKVDDHGEQYWVGIVHVEPLR